MGWMLAPPTGSSCRRAPGCRGSAAAGGHRAAGAPAFLLRRRSWHPYAPSPSRSAGGLMLVGPTVRRVAIVGGMRIPFARGHGAYARVGNQDMFTAVLQALVAKHRIAGERLGDVVAGGVLKHSKDFNLVRECVLSSGLDPQTPGLDIQRACGTGVEAAMIVAHKIALGQIEAGIAAGVDTISDPPVVFPADYRDLLLNSYRGRSF